MARTRGMAALEQRLAAVRRAALDAVTQALVEGGGEVLSRSRDLAPQLTAAMIAHSGVRSEGTPSAERVRVVVFYSEPYAILQHEGFYNPGPVTAAKLGPTFAVGRKFLSRSLDELRPQIVAEAGRALESALRTALR